MSHNENDVILMGHGAGGRLTQSLLDDVMRPLLQNEFLNTLQDSAVLPAETGRIAMTTDSYVVNPLMFPGGNIGSLAVMGSVNDLAMVGAKPRAMSLALIIEEGLPVATLRTIVASIAESARACGVLIVTGDTKVVERGRGDGIYINTSAIGTVSHNLQIEPSRVSPGDAIVISGDGGRHQAAIMMAREQIAMTTAITSDCADLSPQVQALLAAGLEIHGLRDLTRGGLAAALNEIASASGTTIQVEEENIPVDPVVRSFTDILGIDPFSMACEGRFCVILPADQADDALRILASHTSSLAPAMIGRVTARSIAPVTIITAYETERILGMPQGELLPRIC